MRWTRPIEPVEFRGTLAPNRRRPRPRRRFLPSSTTVVFRAIKSRILRARRENDTAWLEQLRQALEPANPWE